MLFSQIGFADSPNTAITVMHVVYEKLYYMRIWIWSYVVDLGIWFPQCNPLRDLRILCVMNVIQNWKLLVFLQNWYCCVQNWTRPFLSDAINFDATSIVILNAPNASKSQWYLYLLLFSKKYFASYLFRVILLLILYLVTTWQKMFVSI